MLTSYFYKVLIESNASSELIQKYKTYSDLFKNDKTVSILSLKNRFEKDKAILKIILCSYGYFKAQIKYTIIQNKEGAFVLTIYLHLDEPFKIQKIHFSGIDDFLEKKLNTRIKLKKDQIFNENTLNMSIERIIRYFKNNGYPFVKIDKPRLKVHFLEKKIDVFIDIYKGDKKYFGPLNINIKNEKNLKPSFIEHTIKWTQGHLFEQRLVDQTKKKLIDSGIISYASIKPEKTDNNQAPIRIKAYESPARTFLAEGGYSTSDKFSGKLSWKHKNLFGNGQSLELSTTVSTIQRNIQAKTKFPHFLNISTLNSLANANWIHETTSAYKGMRGGCDAGLEKEFTDSLLAGLNLNFEIANVEKEIKKYNPTQKKIETFETQEFKAKILSVPFSLTWDKMNDDLDPTRGVKVQINIEPHMFLSGSRKDQSLKGLNDIEKIDKFFTIFKSSIAHALRIYKNRDTNKKIILYNKIAVSNIFGAKLDEIIPHKRMYLGGVHTMRAYGEKKVGVMDDTGRPQGGVSFGMWIAELRFRFKDTWGLNLYNEIGFVSSHQLFHKSDNSHKEKDDGKLFKGSGFSIVYYSKIGPIQGGLTFPWGQRSYYKDNENSTKEAKSTKEARFQFYVGIGQI